MRGLLPVFVILLSGLYNGVQAQQIHSLWLNNHVSIDGDPSEWPQPFRYYDGATKLQFAIANDTSDLYICLKVTDEQAQAKIFRSGLNIWIDPKGKKKESEGIFFPTKQERAPGEHIDREERQPGEQSIQKPDISRLKQHVLMEQITLRVKGFAGVPDQVLNLQNTFGINAAINWDSLNIMCIEYKMPISAVIGHNFSVADTSKPLGLGFVINAVEIARGDFSGPKAGDVTEGSGLRNPGGMNGMGRNGMNGGMGGGLNRESYGMGSYDPNAQEQKVWSKIILGWNQ
jgi:hypothetical protein